MTRPAKDVPLEEMPSPCQPDPDQESPGHGRGARPFGPALGRTPGVDGEQGLRQPPDPVPGPHDLILKVKEPLPAEWGIRPFFTMASIEGSKVDGSQTFGCPLKSHHAEALGRKGLQAQNCVDDCSAMVHFRLSATCEEAAVGMFSVKLPASIFALGTVGAKMLSEM